MRTLLDYRLNMNTKQLGLFFAVIMSIPSSYAAQPTAAPWVGANIKGAPCSGSAQGMGPFDYLQRKRIDSHNLTTVEENHFTRQVENLIQGKSGSLTADLDATLNAWPNHHPALLSMVRYQLRINSALTQDNKLVSLPECYFQRALSFSAKDAVTRSLYGYYLRKIGQLKEAALVYEQALKLAPATSKIEYAYSLVLIDLKQYDHALLQAKNAYKHGKPPAGLKNTLTKMGVWK
jgi:tetratricopeptide (TPR) repeat protein